MIPPRMLESMDPQNPPLIGRTLILTESLDGKFIGQWAVTTGDQHDVREAMFEDLVATAAESFRKD